MAPFKAKVLPRACPRACTEETILRLRWSEDGVHMAPDAKHVENVASLLGVKGAKPSPTPSFRATSRGQRDVLTLMISCGSFGVPQRYEDCFVSRTGQVRSAVCDERARPRHAEGKQVVHAEAQTVWYLLGRQTWDRSSRTRMSQTRCWSGLMVTGVETNVTCKSTSARCCAAGKPHDRDVECEPTGDVAQLG